MAMSVSEKKQKKQFNAASKSRQARNWIIIWKEAGKQKTSLKSGHILYYHTGLLPQYRTSS